MSMGEHTPLHEEWFNPPLRYRGHEIETRYSPHGDTFAGCQCGWRSNRKTRHPLKSWIAHLRREGALRSVLVEFTNGERVVASQRALRYGHLDVEDDVAAISLLDVEV